MKKYMIIIMLLIVGFMGFKNVNAESKIVNNDLMLISDIYRFADETTPIASKGPCTKLKSSLKFIGYIFLIVKIVIPLLLIIFGVIDLFKAVTGGKDGEINKSIKTFVFRLIAGVAIFFVPTIISFIFTLVDGFDSVESEFAICQRCILNVSKCD